MNKKGAIFYASQCTLICRECFCSNHLAKFSKSNQCIFAL